MRSARHLAKAKWPCAFLKYIVQCDKTVLLHGAHRFFREWGTQLSQ